MKLILHHFLKDVRAQRWLLALWFAILFVEMLLDVLVFHPDFGTAEHIEAIRISAFPALVTFIVWTILLARVVHSEPVTGSTSFWLTRPIPTSVYLPSKGIFILFLLVFPCVVPVLFHAYQFQLGTDVVARQIAGLIIFQLYAALLIIWLTTYAPSLVHFAGMLALGVVVVIVIALLKFTLRSHPFDHNSGNPVFISGYFINILTVGLLFSLIVQHAQRRSQAGFIIGVTAILIASAFELCLSNLSRPAVVGAFNNIEMPPAKMVQVDIAPDWQKDLRWSRTSSNGEMMPQAEVNLKLMGPDPEAIPAIRSCDAVFQVPGEKKTPLSSPATNLFYLLNTSQNRSSEILGKLLPGFVIKSPYGSNDFRPITVLFTLDGTLRNKLQNKIGTLTLGLSGRMISLQAQAKIPLQDPHFIFRVPGGFFRVAPTGSSTRSQLVVWRVDSIESPYSYNFHQDAYALVDPRAKTATILPAGGNSSNSGIYGPGGFESDTHTSLNLPDGVILSDDTILYILEPIVGDGFQNTLTVPDFTMNPP